MPLPFGVTTGIAGLSCSIIFEGLVLEGDLFQILGWDEVGWNSTSMPRQVLCLLGFITPHPASNAVVWSGAGYMDVVVIGVVIFSNDEVVVVL